MKTCLSYVYVLDKNLVHIKNLYYSYNMVLNLKKFKTLKIIKSVSYKTLYQTLKTSKTFLFK